MGRTRRKKNL